MGYFQLVQRISITYVNILLIKEQHHATVGFKDVEFLGLLHKYHVPDW